MRLPKLLRGILASLIALVVISYIVVALCPAPKLADGYLLACQAEISGDVVVET
jgi:hypothetical protein